MDVLGVTKGWFLREVPFLGYFGGFTVTHVPQHATAVTNRDVAIRQDDEKAATASGVDQSPGEEHVEKESERKAVPDEDHRAV